MLEELKQFIYSEITERRDYTASKMCEVILDKIEELENVCQHPKEARAYWQGEEYCVRCKTTINE